MRAITVTDFGPPDVLRVSDVADPMPRRAKVLVEVVAVDVLDLDAK